MESKNEKFTGNSGHGRHTRREKKEKKKTVLVQLETNMEKQELKTVQSLKKEVFFVCVISDELGGRARRSDSVVSKATLIGVFVVKELGLTVGEDLDLRRIWTLTNPRCHESI